MYIIFKHHCVHYSTLLQATRGQWTFVIELFEFQNPQNLEIQEMGDNIRFCCCDDDTTCDADINDSSLDSCDNGCDTFVAVLPPNCEEGDECEITTGTVTNLISVSQFGYIFSFDLDELPTEVGHLTLYALCVLGQYIFKAINLG